MIYIYKILSRNNSKIRISFYLPWIGLLIGTIFLILVDSIMDGMEGEIFSKLNEIDSGYKLYPDSKVNSNNLQKFLEGNNIHYYSQNTREVLVGESDNYLFAKLIIRSENENPLSLSIGKGISSKLGLFEGDEIRIFSPLDAKLTTMKFPIKTMRISDIYSVPVLDFDNLYIISNDINFSTSLDGIESLVIQKNISKDKLSSIKEKFPDVEVLSWVDDYSTLINAIRLEKTMYRVFAYLLIIISSLGLFTTMNYTIINKKSSILSIYNLGYSFNKIKKSAYKLMSLLSIVFSISGIILISILLYLDALDPLLDILFPKEIFYDFNLNIDYANAFSILIINTVVILFSVFIPFKSIHSSLNKRVD